jgi:hypothetical protein
MPRMGVLWILGSHLASRIPLTRLLVTLQEPKPRVCQTQPRGLHVQAGIAYSPKRFVGVPAILLITASISYGG